MDAISVGSVDYHRHALDNMCRFCSDRTQPSRKRGTRPVKQCKIYHDTIQAFFGIDINNDVPTIHPAQMCERCYVKMANSKSATSITMETRLKHMREDSDKLWIEHEDSLEGMDINCTLCALFKKQSYGIQFASKTAKRGRPKWKAINLDFSMIDDDIFQGYFVDVPSVKNKHCDLVNLSDTQKNTFMCPLCQSIYDTRSVKSECDHYFCSTCLSKTFQATESNTINCQVCNSALQYKNMTPADQRFRIQILTLQVCCTLCSRHMDNQSIINHNCTPVSPGPFEEDTHESPIMEMCISPIPLISCDTSANLPWITDSSPHIGVVLNSSAVQTTPSLDKMIHHSMNRSITSPLNAEEEKLHTKLTKRKLTFSADKSTILCKTGGQVSLFKFENNRLRFYISDSDKV